MSIQSNFPAINPTLLLDFANTKQLDPRITFTRASTATFIDQFGAMQTAALGVARFDHNPTTLVSLGLLIEEQRTNLVLNSATLVNQNVTVTAVAHTLSFYGTGTVTLSGVSTSGPLVGTGAFPSRVTLTFTPTAGTLTLTVSGTVLLAQLEAGAFATSYIPTVASQVTRAVDAASMTGANFSSWYNQAAGTLYAEYNLGLDSISSEICMLDNGTSSNAIQMRYASGSQAQYLVVVGGVSQANFAPVGYSATGNYKRAVAYETNSFQQAINNALPDAEDTSGTLPVVSIFRIGFGTGGNYLNGTIKKIAYYPLRVTNAQLQGLTS